MVYQVVTSEVFQVNKTFVINNLRVKVAQDDQLIYSYQLLSSGLSKLLDVSKFLFEMAIQTSTNHS